MKQIQRRRMLLMLLMDALWIAAAMLAGVALRFEGQLAGYFTADYLAEYLLLAECVYIPLLTFGGIYRTLWRYAGAREALSLTGLTLLGGALSLAVNALFGLNLSPAVLGFACVLVVCFVGGSRLLWRVLSFMLHPGRGKAKSGQPRRLLVFGAGAGGAYVINLCNRQKNPIGVPVVVVDDDSGKQGLLIQKVPIKGTREDIPLLAEKYRVQEIVIAVATSQIKDIGRLISLCKSTSCRIRILTQIQGLNETRKNSRLWLRELNVSDLLLRKEIQLDLANCDYLAGKTVLVTGGGGSIGSELCRQIMQCSPKLLIAFDIYENNVYELECELRQLHNGECRMKVLIGSVCDRKRLEEVFSQYSPEVVFHAAAHKHVPLMEGSPGEAVKNNVFGTKAVLEAAEAHGAERFVLLSTDKAVNPTSIMGATKRIAEIMLQLFAKNSAMKCMAVRFGNVLASHGSVVPLFQSQIRQGGPVTVTHPDIVRYFMTIPEAAQLVLQAGGLAQSGSIYALDMGEPVQIMKLAETMIRYYGYEPNVDMPIKITGLRPGEKLYEELLTEAERSHLINTGHPKIFIAPLFDVRKPRFSNQLQLLERAVYGSPGGGEAPKDLIQALIKQLVPTYAYAPGEEAEEAAAPKLEYPGLRPGYRQGLYS